ncbi:hypothetical protein V3C99_006558, partial [Haemonchus contortus]
VYVHVYVYVYVHVYVYVYVYVYVCTYVCMYVCVFDRKSPATSNIRANSEEIQDENTDDPGRVSHSGKSRQLLTDEGARTSKYYTSRARLRGAKARELGRNVRLYNGEDIKGTVHDKNGYRVLP